MRHWLPIATVAGLASACSVVDGPSSTVLIDGLFDEWSEAVTLIDDPPDAPDASVDLLSVQALDDPRWLYLALDVGNEVSLQALPGTLHLLVDADGERGTGGSQHGMEGVDLIVDLSAAPSPLAEARRAGFGVRLVADDGTTRALARETLGLIAAPTWSAPRFELRLSRRVPEAGATLASRSRLKAVYSEDGSVRDDTEIGAYAFRTGVSDATSVSAPSTDVDRRLSQAPGSLRVAVWNVAMDSFTRHMGDFGRVLAALAPDVVLLDELPGELITNDQLDAFFASEGLAGLGPWSVTMGETGALQRAAVAVRGHRVTPAAAMLSVHHPRGALDALLNVAEDRWREYLTTVEAERGVSAAGAWVDVDGQRVLFVAADLQSAGWLDSPRDRLRTLQAEALRTHVAAELGGDPAPVVIGGDLNLVGSRRPLFTLMRGLDVDGSDLVPVDAERLGERSLATWRNPRDLFAPGRLDFLLVPDAAVSVVNSFVFATEELDDAALDRLGLERELMQALSDHLVLVADVLVRGATGSVASDGLTVRPRE